MCSKLRCQKKEKCYAKKVLILRNVFYNYASSFLRFVHDGYTGYALYGGSKNLDKAAEIKRSNMLPRDRLGKVTKGFFSVLLVEVHFRLPCFDRTALFVLRVAWKCSSRVSRISRDSI